MAETSKGKVGGKTVLCGVDVHARRAGARGIGCLGLARALHLRAPLLRHRRSSACALRLLCRRLLPLHPLLLPLCRQLRCWRRLLAPLLRRRHRLKLRLCCMAAVRCAPVPALLCRTHCRRCLRCCLGGGCQLGEAAGPLEAAQQRPQPLLSAALQLGHLLRVHRRRVAQPARKESTWSQSQSESSISACSRGAHSLACLTLCLVNCIHHTPVAPFESVSVRQSFWVVHQTQ